MKIARLPGEARRRLPELLLTLLVLAGLANCVVRFHVDGKLPQPFVFDINDTWMDWFNTAYWAHHPGAFDVWRTVYPPLSFDFLGLFGISDCYLSSSLYARDCDWVGKGTILASFAIGAGLAALAFWRAEPRTALFRGVAFGLGLPWLYTLERGNLILPCFIFFVLAYGDIARSRVVRAIGVAVTINFKPYLLVPALADVAKRHWRYLELAAFATLSVYLASFALFGSGSPAEIVANLGAWVTGTTGFVWEQVYYSTSFAPFLEFNTYRFPTHEFLAQKTIDPFFHAIPILINISRVLGLATMAGAWLQPQALTRNRIALVLLATSLINQSPGGYTEVFLVFLLFLERWERLGPIVALTMGYLLSVPYDYVLSNIVTLTGDSWLGGRTISSPFGVSVGMFVRPALIVLMQWALTLDSVLLIARAHRLRRPTLEVAPPAAPALQPA
ncbi:hypothetical protein [Sphingomonas sp.]|uniref:hypothetical protein n=1 Tax=Sphingomonas sp. TaxID=28214 RepID=UPI003CC53351